MHIKMITVMVALSILPTAAVRAAPAPTKPGAPAAAPTAAPTASPAPSGASKKLACRQTAVGKKLKKPEYVTFIKSCMADAKKECQKEALTKKVERAKLRDYIVSCLG